MKLHRFILLLPVNILRYNRSF